MGQCLANHPNTVGTAATRTTARLLAELRAFIAYPKPTTGGSIGGEGVTGTIMRDTLTEMTAAAEFQGPCNASN